MELVQILVEYDLTHGIDICVSENCTICEIFRISAHCLTCLQGLCSECDRLYHSYPERANHRRTAVTSASSSSSSSQNRSSHRSGSIVTAVLTENTLIPLIHLRCRVCLLFSKYQSEIVHFRIHSLSAGIKGVSRCMCWWPSFPLSCPLSSPVWLWIFHYSFPEDKTKGFVWVLMTEWIKWLSQVKVLELRCRYEYEYVWNHY